MCVKETSAGGGGKGMRAVYKARKFKGRVLLEL
jgi:acetyl/propionyl-CoA carboxylase alpha subunit